jgi:hypothetical protein
MGEIDALAALIRKRNEIAAQITKLIGRPAQIGHIGEYIASKVFNVELHASASSKGSDGKFRSGSLREKSVNVKFYAKCEGLLDIRDDALPDYFLVFSGPRSQATTSRREDRLWSIDWAFLINAKKLHTHFIERGVKGGIATSVTADQWNLAEVFPASTNTELILSEAQKSWLQLFASDVVARSNTSHITEVSFV